MFQLVNLILSSRECGVKLASVINVALGSLWFSLLLYSITVFYSINGVLSCLELHLLVLTGFTSLCSCLTVTLYFCQNLFYQCASSVLY